MQVCEWVDVGCVFVDYFVQVVMWFDYGVGCECDVFELGECVDVDVVIQYYVVFQDYVDVDLYIVVYVYCVMDVQVCWVQYVCVLCVQCMYCVQLLGMFELGQLLWVVGVFGFLCVVYECYFCWGVVVGGCCEYVGEVVFVLCVGVGELGQLLMQCG